MANGLVAHNLLRTPGKNPLESGKELPLQAERIRLLVFKSDADESAGIAQDLASRHSDELGNVAVIARTKNLLSKIQGELAKLGVAAQITQRRDTFASVPYQWLHSSLQVANRRSDAREFAAFVESGNALLGTDLDAGELIGTALSGHGDFLRTWVANVESSDESAEKAIALIKTDLVERNDFRRYVRALTALFTDPQWALEDNQPSFDEDVRAWRELFIDIQGTVGRDAPLDTFLQELDLRSKEPPIKPGVVPLLTIHGSKGNEFRHVYLMGMAEDILPSFQSKKRGDLSPQLEEERRNCFVAITRCMDTLTMSRAETYNGWAKAPSRFLSEMGVA